MLCPPPCSRPVEDCFIARPLLSSVLRLASKVHTRALVSVSSRPPHVTLFPILQPWNTMTVLSLPSALAPQPADVGKMVLEDGGLPPPYTQLLSNAMLQLLNVVTKEARWGPPSCVRSRTRAEIDLLICLHRACAGR